MHMATKFALIPLTETFEVNQKKMVQSVRTNSVSAKNSKGELLLHNVGTNGQCSYLHYTLPRILNG